MLDQESTGTMAVVHHRYHDSKDMGDVNRTDSCNRNHFDCNWIGTNENRKDSYGQNFDWHCKTLQ